MSGEIGQARKKILYERYNNMLTGVSQKSLYELCRDKNADLWHPSIVRKVVKDLCRKNENIFCFLQ